MKECLPFEIEKSAYFGKLLESLTDEIRELNRIHARMADDLNIIATAVEAAAATLPSEEEG